MALREGDGGVAGGDGRMLGGAGGTICPREDQVGVAGGDARSSAVVAAREYGAGGVSVAAAVLLCMAVEGAGCEGAVGFAHVANGFGYAVAMIGLPNDGDSGGLPAGVEKVKAAIYGSFPLLVRTGVVGDVAKIAGLAGGEENGVMSASSVVRSTGKLTGVFRWPGCTCSHPGCSTPAMINRSANLGTLCASTSAYSGPYVTA